MTRSNGQPSSLAIDASAFVDTPWATREITCEALRLPEHEREIVLGIVRKLGEARYVGAAT
jgi:hypothetical protein